MHILINHLTRMRAPRICVAGIEPNTKRHIRPTTSRDDPITRNLLADHGGPFQLGTLVDLGIVRANPSPPESEDYLFETVMASAVGRLKPTDYLELLDRLSQHDMGSIFGPELERQGRTLAIEEGHGTASLGVIRAQRPPDLNIDEYGKLRLRFNDLDQPASLVVTDLRFVEADQSTLKRAVVADVQARMQRGVPTLLMVGLARAYLKPGDDRKRHWLQVNGICLEDHPLRDVP
jgi:uncharacterized protein